MNTKRKRQKRRRRTANDHAGDGDPAVDPGALSHRLRRGADGGADAGPALAAAAERMEQMRRRCNGKFERHGGDLVRTEPACPAYYKAQKGDHLGGWIKCGDTMICVESPSAKGRELQPFAPYCMATLRAKKIANPADWNGRTPPWCPLNKKER